MSDRPFRRRLFRTTDRQTMPITGSPHALYQDNQSTIW